MKTIKLATIFVMIVLLSPSNSRAGWLGPSTVQECHQKKLKQNLWPRARQAFQFACNATWVDGTMDRFSNFNEEERSNLKKSASCFYASGIRGQLATYIEVKRAALHCAKDEKSLRVIERWIDAGD